MCLYPDNLYVWLRAPLNRCDCPWETCLSDSTVQLTIFGLSPNPTMSTDEDGAAVQLGAGSFATAYVMGGRLIFFKKAPYITNAEKPGEEDAESVTTSTIIIVKLPGHFSRFGALPPIYDADPTTAPLSPSASGFVSPARSPFLT